MRPPPALLARYDYPLTGVRIAEEPAAPRESARLMVYNPRTHKEHLTTFAHLAEELPTGSVLVLNDTKVVPARIPARKPTGGLVELLWLSEGPEKGTFSALSPKRLALGDTLFFLSHTLTVRAAQDSTYTIAYTGSAHTFRKSLTRKGRTPLPPYIKHSPLSEKALRTRYQTTFAMHEGSVAAPTASLHFSKKLLRTLRTRGVSIVHVTLHVGLGTFAPLTETHLRLNTLHAERYDMPLQTYRALAKAQKENRPIIPVGTTALRTIETVFGAPKKTLTGHTTLFIREGYRFRIASGLITNFHVPRSSLLMLVGALIGRKTLLTLYEKAVRYKMRFFSFGDGMLILPR